VLTLCISVVVAAGLALVWVRVVQTLTAPSSAPKAVGQPGALMWDGRVFTSSGQLKAYLSSKGRSYSRWVARHPTAFGATAPTVAHHATTKKKPKPTKAAAKPKPKPKPKPTTTAKRVTHHVAAPATVSATKSKPLTSMVLTILLLVGGLALGASAALPTRYTPVAVQQFYTTPDRRMVALAAATAILLGFGVSFYLT
jgi:hypothetical protein